MDASEIKRTTFSVSDFLSWQKDGTLDLNPPFQRRSVWNEGAKSYLVDTVAKGLPTPLIFIREQIDLESLKHRREVIDGQQRLRTLFAYIDESSLPDFDPERDRFVVRRQHNATLGGKRFAQLDPKVRERILGYEFSTHVLPTSTEARDVLMIFARLNSTGMKLNFQELRNAAWFGEFKTLMYQVSYEQLERWLRWGIFDGDGLARMQEVELVSDLVSNMLTGLQSKSQAGLDKVYGQYDEKFPQGPEAARRFRLVMDAVDELLGQRIARTVYRSTVHFFTLFTYLYDELFGLGSRMERISLKPTPANMAECLLKVSEQFSTERVPEYVLDALQRASTDRGRRQTRLDYLKASCGAKAD